MSHDLTYVFNDRHYHLVSADEGWQIIYQRLSATPVTQDYPDYATARRAYWRRIACTILLNPRRLRGADINGTLLALVADTDGRLHLAHHGPPDTDRAKPYTDRVAAFTAWRDACWHLAHQATRTIIPAASTGEHQPILSALPAGAHRHAAVREHRTGQGDGATETA